MKTFIEWFDPHNKEHIKAYVRLQETGCWPKGFVPDDVEMENHWLVGICSKMADAWVKYQELKSAGNYF